MTVMTDLLGRSSLRTIRWRLRLALALLVAALVGNTVVLSRSYIRTTAIVENVRLMEASIGSIFETTRFVRDYLESRDDRAARQWHEAYRRIGDNLSRLNELPTDTASEKLIARRLKSNLVIMGTLFDRLVSTVPGHAESLRLLEQGLSMRTDLMVADAYKLSAIHNAEIARERLAFIWTLAGSVLSSVLVGLFIFFVNARVLRSLTALRLGSERIAGGDFETAIILGGHDEFTGLAADMTAMAAQIHRSYTALRGSEERSQTIFERSPQPMWVYDETTLRFLAVNARAIEHYGFTAEEFFAMTLRDIRPAEDVAILERVVIGPSPGDRAGEWRHRKKDGSVIDVSIHSVQIRYGDRPARIALVLDITDRKAAEMAVVRSTRLLQDQARKLRQANAELEQFAYVASHDLRQPLRMVSSYLSLLDRHLGDRLDDQAREFIGYALGGAKRMDRLILDLLGYSRIGRSGESMEPVALAHVAAQAVGDFCLGMDEVQGQVIIGDLPEVRGHAGELERLFQNLIGNALKYRSPDRAPEVTICSHRDGDATVVTVADNGIGIPADSLERVFGVFQRLHANKSIEGTGIGLASCRKIVEHHGGKIWVESVVGEGSTFSFTLPGVAE